MVKTFSEFINEDFTFDPDVLCDYTLNDRNYSYDIEDELILGNDNEQPNSLFTFNPKSCTIRIDGKTVKYDLNNPLCLIRYKYKDNEVEIYKEDDVIKYLNMRECEITGDISSMENRKKIQKLFINDEDNGKSLLMFGVNLLVSTFDIIEEE